MQINKKLISVIIPVYNSEKFLKRSINSVLNQTYKFLEVVIVDDCSTDNSIKIIKKFANIDKRVKYYKTKKNSGTVAVPRNIGIKKARGDFLAFLDSDDFWKLNKLEIQMNSYKKGSLISCSACDYISEKNKIKSGYVINNLRIILQKFFIKKINEKEHKWLYLYNPVIVSSVLVSKNIFKNFLFEEGVNTREDLDFWLKISSNSKNLFNYTSKILLTIERRNSSLSSNYFEEFNKIILSISNHFISKKNYKSFSFFIWGIFLKVLKAFLKRNYLSFKKNFLKIFFTISLVIFSFNYTPLTWYIGNTLLYSNKTSFNQTVVIFSGHGGKTYFNDTYMNRFKDISYYLDRSDDKDKIKIIIYGRFQEIPEQKILESLLVADGIKKSNITISYEFNSNTKNQIESVYKILKNNSEKEITFITSPYHTLRSKKLWDKNAKDIKVNIFKTLDWPKKNRFFQKSQNKEIIYYQIRAYLYNLLRGWI